MPHISKHHTEKEWKSNNSNNCRICLQVSWNTISVNNQLKHFSEIICFNISRLCYGVIFINLNSNCSVTLNFLLNLYLLFYRSPKEANKLLILPFHHVQCLEKRFFFGHKHFIDIKSGCLFLILRIYSIERMKLINESLSCLLKDISGISYWISNSYDLLCNFRLSFRKLVSLAWKWIANFLYSLSYMATFPIDNNVYTFFIFLELKIFLNLKFIGNSNRFSFSSSENESLKSKKICLIDHTSHFIEICFILILNKTSIFITASATIFNIILIVSTNSLKSLINLIRILSSSQHFKTIS